MKVLLFSDLNETITRMTHTFQESQVLLHHQIDCLRSLVAMRKPYPYHNSMDAVIKDLTGSERMLAAVVESPFQLTTVRDAKTLLDETEFEDWFVIFIDMEHPQVRDVIFQLARQMILMKFKVYTIIKNGQYDTTSDDVMFSSTYGCSYLWDFKPPVHILIALNKLLA